MCVTSLHFALLTWFPRGWLSLPPWLLPPGHGTQAPWPFLTAVAGSEGALLEGEPVQPGHATALPDCPRRRASRRSGPASSQHESEILPFPNPERNFVLPEEIIQEVREGKVVIEEDTNEEMKEDVDPHNVADDVFSSSGSLGKATEKSSKDKDKSNSDLGSKEGPDKRKRSRVTDKVLTANSNPSSPSAAKRRRT
ncbi:MRG/MORF4L-binding protein isoform X2 [Tursiops truncatus]|uniref:MRG/MORF4L-binding protein isoform X2 n=1 Tax=Tursiops truncatus TaxID=9739 RepID=A0A6J3Q0M5_TURTR|nr:MRG/MORF4L-binding protein isoform X2 [Globicephala melas]XP_033695663.1 MRG/MORF4L-binding protein isoform X2 [Tursiops truncatus]